MSNALCVGCSSDDEYYDFAQLSFTAHLANIHSLSAKSDKSGFPQKYRYNVTAVSGDAFLLNGGQRGAHEGLGNFIDI